MINMLQYGSGASTVTLLLSEVIAANGRYVFETLNNHNIYDVYLRGGGIITVSEDTGKAILQDWANWISRNRAF